MLELIFNIIVTFIFRYPGAFIRWAIGGFRKHFSIVLEEGFPDIDGFIGFLFIVFVLISAVIFL
jgi:hypothetical protein